MAVSMSRILVFLLCIISTVKAQECVCTTNGISDGVRTRTPGCLLGLEDRDGPACYVESSANCPETWESSEFPGASLIECPVEDALFYAAETNNVNTTMRLRELGASLTATRRVRNRRINLEFSLISYAAAYGSFAVLEDLLLNQDYICTQAIEPEDALCMFSEARKCDETSTQRESISFLIDFTYGQDCAGIDPSGSAPEVSASVASPSVGLPRYMSDVAASVGSVLVQCGSYPFFVSVRSSFNGGYTHRCGGVLVAEDAVLTAAHCVDGSQGFFDPILVIAAYERDESGFCDEQSEVRKATSIILHPRWSKGQYARSVGNGKDVALLQLNRPSEKEPIRISSRQRLGVGESLQFLGMGRTSSGSTFSQELQIAAIDAARRSTCQREYPNGIRSDVLCVGGRAADFCAGDDGGPLFRMTVDGPELVGIAHLKHPMEDCGTRGVPGLYSNAAELEKWIRQTRRNQF